MGAQVKNGLLFLGVAVSQNFRCPSLTDDLEAIEMTTPF
jgi:hypothetical protein